MRRILSFVAVALLALAPCASAQIGAEHVFYGQFVNTADSDSTDMVVDGSSTAVNFDVVHPGGKDPVVIHRIMVKMIDGSITELSFGGISALSNGLRIVVYDTQSNTEVADFLPGDAITRNYDWTTLAGNDQIVEPAAGDDVLKVRWTIELGLGDGLLLRPTEVLRVIVQDALAGISEFSMSYQGRK